MVMNPEVNEKEQEKETAINANMAGKYGDYIEKAKLNQRERDKIQEQANDARLETKFFSLEIGQEAAVFIDTDRTESFKAPVGQSKELQIQYRYYLEDLRTKEGTKKQWDTFPNVAAMVNDCIAENGKLILIRCHRGKNGGKNFRPYPIQEEGQSWEIDIKNIDKEE